MGWHGKRRREKTLAWLAGPTHVLDASAANVISVAVCSLMVICHRLVVTVFRTVIFS